MFKKLFITSLLLGVVIFTLFYRSFLPNYALFANDAPLAALNTAVMNSWQTVRGWWDTCLWWDLNWLGYGTPISSLTFTIFIQILFNALGFINFYTPISLIFLGGAVAFYALSQKYSLRISILLGLAAALNSTFFSYGAWGLGNRVIGAGWTFIAIAFLCDRSSGLKSWVKTLLAGGAVGMTVIEGQDLGALLSLYVAAFSLFVSLFFSVEKSWLKRVGLGLLRIFCLVIMAVAISFPNIVGLSSDYIGKIAGIKEQDTKSKEQRWDWATQWSLPKIETIRLLVPGFFGYRMDTPEGGNYWGEVGRTPGYEQHKQGFARYSGAGDYPGLLVLIGAGWALASSFRRKKIGNVAESLDFSDRERKIIWFWGGAAVFSLLLAWGRHAPFYQFIYTLPYFSTIRNPVKFMHPFALSLLILFSYSLLDWQRRYFRPIQTSEKDNKKTIYNFKQIKSWLNKQATPFEKKWFFISQILVGLAFLGLLIVVGLRGSITDYLKANDFGGAADYIVAHVITEMWSFLGFLVVSLGVLITVLAGWWRGKKAMWGWLILTFVLLLDLGRANWPWIQYYNYKERYASNPVIDKLKEKPPYYGRVSILARQFPLYNEWHQHHFLYYNIQCLEFAQLPRVPEDYAAYMGALQTNPLRLWELTNTRYFLAGADTTEQLNQQLDPKYKRFQTALQFGLEQTEEGAYQMTIGQGNLALIEFPNVLARAQLYRSWRVVDDATALRLLPDPNFDIFHEVLVSRDSPLTLAQVGVNDASGDEVNYVSYEPKKIVLRSKNVDACLLLVNDKYDSSWKVTVNGKSTPLLRCNYIMRGVQLPAGENEIVMEFKPPLKGFLISAVALISWIGLGIFLVVRYGSDRSSQSELGEKSGAIG